MSMIRVARPQDAPVVCSLVLGFRDHLRAKTPSEAELAATLPNALADPALEFCCAWLADGKPVGYTQTRFFRSIWRPGTEAHLEDLFVVEAARGRGTGRALLDFALDRARARGAHAIGLHTNERNLRAHQLYRRAGFEPRTEEAWSGGREMLWSRTLDSEAG